MELSENQNFQLIKLLEELASRQAGVPLIFTPVDGKEKTA